MATRIPNPLNEALIRSSERLLDVMLSQRRMAQDESQFQRTLSQREDELAERQRQFNAQFSEAQKGAALQRLSFLAPFLKGKTAAEIPYVQEDLNTLYPEFGGQFADPRQLGSLQFGTETFNEYLQQRMIETYESLPDDVRSQLDERSVYRGVTGTATTGERLEADENLFNIRYDRAMEMFENPRVLDQVVRGWIGAPEPISVTVGDKSYSWDSVDEARIAVSLMGLKNQEAIAALQAGQEAGGQLVDLAKDLRDLAREKDIGISLGMAQSIIRAIHTPLGEGETMDQRIADLDLSANGQAALQMYLNGVSLAPRVRDTLDQVAPEALFYFDLVSMAKNEGMPAEQINTFIPKLARQLENAGVGTAYRRAWGSWNVGEISSIDRPTTSGSGGMGGGGALDPAAVVQIMRDDAAAFAEGTMTEAELVQKYGFEGAQAIIAEAGGVQ